VQVFPLPTKELAEPQDKAKDKESIDRLKEKIAMLQVKLRK
jgi:hypothetical protein